MNPMSPAELFEQAGDRNGRGGKIRVARWTGLSPSAMTNWSRDLDRVPAEQCKAIEKGSGGRFPRHVLRPDLWDPPEEAVA